MTPKFSLLTITYNAEKYVRETLHSIFSQNFSHFESIVWDGGSSDRTLEIVSSFPKVRLYQGKDEGISDAMNKAASFAQGEFLLFLHADDLLHHPGVLKQVELALKQHPSYRWLYGQVELIDEASNRLRIEPLVPFCKNKLKRYNILPHPATFIERKLFEEVGGFRPELKYAMDYELWLRLAKITTPFALPALISSFRVHPHSLSTSRPVEVAKEAFHVRELHTRGLYQRWRSKRTLKRRLCSIDSSKG